MTKGYSIIAIIVFKTLLIFTLSNLLVFAGIELWKEIHPPYLPTSSMSQMQTVSPGITKPDILTLLEETWERPFQYQPFAGFKERPRTGQFVNISEEKFRFTQNKNF